MEDSYLWYLLGLGGLFVLSAFFSGSETALLSLDKLRLKYLVEKQRRGARQLEGLLSRPDRLLGAILVGNNLVNIALSVFATSLFVQVFGARGELYTILILTPVLLVVAEVCPKSIAAQFPERFAFLVWRPIRWIQTLLTPVIWLVTILSRWLTRLFAGRQPEGPFISRDELRTLLQFGKRSGAVAQEQHQMLEGIFELAQMRVRDVMIPRTQVVGIQLDTDFNQLIALIRQAHHSRFPVYDGDLDHVKGIIHAKDVFQYLETPEAFSLPELLREPYFVPESKRIETLLHTFRRKHVHLALVVDEYGGVEGIVTLEDVVEQIVGEIQDEYDEEAEMFQELSPSHFLVAGSVPLRTVHRRLGLDLAAGEANTLAGYVLHNLGHIPTEGEEVLLPEATLRVYSLEDNRIHQVELLLAPLATEPEL